MIPRLLCWLFGHKHWSDVFTGQTAKVTDRLTQNEIVVPVLKPVQNAVCPRCMKPLTKETR